MSFNGQHFYEATCLLKGLRARGLLDKPRQGGMGRSAWGRHSLHGGSVSICLSMVNVRQ